MPMVTSEEHLSMARLIKQNYSLYQQNRDLITIGAYQRGADHRLDQAIAVRPVLDQFLQQRMKEVIPYDTCLEQLQQVASALNRGR